MDKGYVFAIIILSFALFGCIVVIAGMSQNTQKPQSQWLPTWENNPEVITPYSYMTSLLPDGFTVNLTIQTNVTSDFYLMNTYQFSEWVLDNYTVDFPVQQTSIGTSYSQILNISRGCSTYILITAPVNHSQSVAVTGYSADLYTPTSVSTCQS